MSFRNERPYPFCPGCGHQPILESLNKAFVQLGIDANQVVIVSDIGCSGLSDQYFTTNAFHGLHGRSVTYASGIKIARPELNVVVIMGDGGCGIGGHHLISAARRNVGMTVIVMNNLNFGMTGGQHSVSTPMGAVTATTREGHVEWPMDICQTVGVNGAAYVRRTTNFDRELDRHLATAMRRPGFALFDIWDMCTAYYQPMNEIKAKDLEGTMERLNMESGLLYEREREDFPIKVEGTKEEKVEPPKIFEARYSPNLKKRMHLVIAGSAGGKVRSASRHICHAALQSGLFASQQDDFPITIKKGHSVSEVILSPQPFAYTGGDKPDVALILSEDGLKMVKGYLAKMHSTDRVYVVPAFQEVETAATVEVIDPKAIALTASKLDHALIAVKEMISRLGILSADALP